MLCFAGVGTVAIDDVPCAIRSMLSHLGLSAGVTANVHALGMVAAESMSMYVCSDGREKDGAMEWLWVRM